MIRVRISVEQDGHDGEFPVHAVWSAERDDEGNPGYQGDAMQAAILDATYWALHGTGELVKYRSRNVVDGYLESIREVLS